MNSGQTNKDLRWTARRVRPSVALYVVGIFLAMIAVSYFVFDSTDAVKALLLAALGSLVTLVPGMLGRVEYRQTESGIAKRPHKKAEPVAFEDLFSWDELSHCTRTKSGFKFYKQIDEGSALSRFLKRHVSGDYSGELHVEPADRPRVWAAFDQQNIPVVKTTTRRGIGPHAKR